MVRLEAGEAWRPLVRRLRGRVDFGVLPVPDGRQHCCLQSVGTERGRLVRVDLAPAGIEVLAEDADVRRRRRDGRSDTRRGPQTVTFIKDRLELSVLDAVVRAETSRPSRPSTRASCT